MTPRVSVVMSVYNNAQTVQRAVESILGQTLRDLEFIIINDGSNDGSTELLRELSSGDVRIHLIEQENCGLTRSLIRGCEAAQAPYIARQDADDWSHLERLTRQADLLDTANDVSFVSCATRYVGPGGEPLELLVRAADSAEATRQLDEERAGPPAHGSVMFRKRAYENVGGYRSEFYLSQDSDLWLRLIDEGRFACLQEQLYSFSRNALSLSSIHREAQRTLGRLCRACHDARRRGETEVALLNEAQQISDAVRQRRTHSASIEATSALEYLVGSRLARFGDPAARGYLWSVIRKRPWHWKAWIRLIQSYVTKLNHQAKEEPTR